MIQEELGNLISLVKEIAPDVWEIVMRQVYLEAIGNLGLVILFLIGAFLAYRVGPRLREKLKRHAIEDEYIAEADTQIMLIASYFLIVSFLVIAPILFYNSMVKLSNPGFYAIQRLLEFLP